MQKLRNPKQHVYPETISETGKEVGERLQGQVMEGRVSQAEGLRLDPVGSGDSAVTCPARQGPLASVCEAPGLRTNSRPLGMG